MPLFIQEQETWNDVTCNLSKSSVRDYRMTSLLTHRYSIEAPWNDVIPPGPWNTAESNRIVVSPQKKDSICSVMTSLTVFYRDCITQGLHWDIYI
jgi:hypothetical protein